MCDNTHKVWPTRELTWALSKVFIKGQSHKRGMPTWLTRVTRSPYPPEVKLIQMGSESKMNKNRCLPSITQLTWTIWLWLKALDIHRDSYQTEYGKVLEITSQEQRSVLSLKSTESDHPKPAELFFYYVWAQLQFSLGRTTQGHGF